MTWTVTLEEEPSSAERDAIVNALIAYNVAAVGEGGYTPFAITVRGEDGAVAGGLWGSIWHGFLFVEVLAMGPARNEGVGRQVMQLAEEEARRRGCTGIWLDTFTFQAPWFYPKLGFTEFGRITAFPPGHDRIFLVKRLEPQAS